MICMCRNSDNYIIIISSSISMISISSIKALALSPQALALSPKYGVCTRISFCASG